MPSVARAYLSTAAVADPLSPNDTLAPLRREALDVLGRAYASRGRLGAGALAWSLGLAAALLGAVATGRWQTADGAAAWLTAGAALLGLTAAALGVLVVRAGSVLSRAVAAWLATPTRSGRTRDAARPHRAIATRATLGFAAAALLLVIVALLVRELVLPPAGSALAALDVTTERAASTTWGTELPILLALAAAALVTATAAASLLSGVNRIHSAAWQPTPAPAPSRNSGDGPAENRQTVVMLLVPGPARNFLDPADYRRDWTTFGSMMIRRQAALRTLVPAFADLGRLGAGVLGWLAALLGATLLRASAGGGSAFGLTGVAAGALGAALAVVGLALGVVVLAAGSRLARGVALWALMPLLIREDGARRAAGSGNVGRPARGPQDEAASLGARPLTAVVAALVAVAWTVELVRDLLDLLAPFATGSDLGVLLASALGAGVSWTAAAATWRGWRRVRGALVGRTTPAQEAAALRELHGRTRQTPAAPVSSHAPGAVTGPAVSAPPGSPRPAWMAAPGAGSEPQASTPDAIPSRPSVGAPPAEGAPPIVGVAPTVDAAPIVGAAPAELAVPRPHRSEVAQVRVGGRLLEPGTTLVGRAPAARAGERVDHTLAVEDPTMSKTHLAVRVSRAGVWVTDRASTNGTTVVTDRGEERLGAWQETKVPAGSRVRAGATVLAVAGEETDNEIESTVLRGNS
ncbi:FHA domain-containing protein [Georgenia daeguensis]|uniref:FHA domain-containing protein n=1 Tax=Georgenia daeguensis TaxID=908355 RepID=UPI0031E90BB0